MVRGLLFVVSLFAVGFRWHLALLCSPQFAALQIPLFREPDLVRRFG
jgi:hypothetical protein